MRRYTADDTPIVAGIAVELVRLLRLQHAAKRDFTMSEPTIFLIRPYRGGWQAFESPGVEPYYVGPKAKEQAISYVLNCRIAHRYGEIRVVDKDGNTLEVIPFDELANEPRSPSAAVSDLVSR